MTRAGTTIVALDARAWGTDQIDPERIGRFIHLDLALEGNILKVDLISDDADRDRRVLVNSDQFREALVAAGASWAMDPACDSLDRLTGEGRR